MLNRFKARVLIDILYWKNKIDERERDMAKLSIDSYFEKYKGPLPGSNEFRRIYDFCVEHILPCAERSVLVKIMLAKV